MYYQLWSSNDLHTFIVAHMASNVFRAAMDWQLAKPESHLPCLRNILQVMDVGEEDQTPGVALHCLYEMLQQHYYTSKLKSGLALCPKVLPSHPQV